MSEEDAEQSRQKAEKKAKNHIDLTIDQHEDMAE